MEDTKVMSSVLCLEIMAWGVVHILQIHMVVSQIVSAPWEADVEQLSHPQQQMRVYNCTRQWNNRDSVCYETSTHTKSFCSGREQVQRGSWSHQIPGWCKGVGVQLLEPNAIISNSMSLYVSYLMCDLLAGHLLMGIRSHWHSRCAYISLSRLSPLFSCSSYFFSNICLLRLWMSLWFWCSFIFTANQCRDLSYEWERLLGNVLIKSLFCKLKNNYTTMWTRHRFENNKRKLLFFFFRLMECFHFRDQHDLMLVSPQPWHRDRGKQMYYRQHSAPVTGRLWDFPVGYVQIQ